MAKATLSAHLCEAHPADAQWQLVPRGHRAARMSWDPFRHAHLQGGKGLIHVKQTTRCGEKIGMFFGVFLCCFFVLSSVFKQIDRTFLVLQVFLSTWLEKFKDWTPSKGSKAPGCEKVAIPWVATVGNYQFTNSLGFCDLFQRFLKTLVL